MTTPPQPNPRDSETQQTVRKAATGTVTVLGVLIGICCVLPLLFVACSATLENLGK